MYRGEILLVCITREHGCMSSCSVCNINIFRPHIFVACMFYFIFVKFRNGNGFLMRSLLQEVTKRSHERKTAIIVSSWKVTFSSCEK